jgi:hypothetical protein
MPSTPSRPHLSLGDLAQAHPADRTLENLLGTLSAKLDLCSRLPIYAYEAGADGHDEIAAAFQRLTTSEHRAFHELLEGLRGYLATTPAPKASAAKPATP